MFAEYEEKTQTVGWNAEAISYMLSQSVLALTRRKPIEPHFKRALELARESGLKKEEALVLHGYAILAMMAGEAEDAVGYMDKAKAIVDEFPEESEHAGEQRDNMMLRISLLEARGVYELVQASADKPEDEKKEMIQKCISTFESQLVVANKAMEIAEDTGSCKISLDHLSFLQTMMQARKAKEDGTEAEASLMDRYKGILYNKWLHKYGVAQSSFWFLEGLVLPRRLTVPRLVTGVSEDEECPYWERWQLQAKMHLKYAQEKQLLLLGSDASDEQKKAPEDLGKEIEELRRSFILINYHKIASRTLHLNYQLWDMMTIPPHMGEAIQAAILIPKTHRKRPAKKEEEAKLSDPETIKAEAKIREAASNVVDAADELKEFDEEL